MSKVHKLTSNPALRRCTGVNRLQVFSPWETDNGRVIVPGSWKVSKNVRPRRKEETLLSLCDSGQITRKMLLWIISLFGFVSLLPPILIVFLILQKKTVSLSLSLDVDEAVFFWIVRCQRFVQFWPTLDSWRLLLLSADTNTVNSVSYLIHSSSVRLVLLVPLLSFVLLPKRCNLL